MQAYVDDSMSDGRVLVLGGLIASTERWRAFSTAWQRCLDHAPWDVFKMHAVSHRCTGNRLQHAQRHYRAVCEHVQGGLCFVVPIGPLEESATRSGLSGTSASKPYFWAHRGIINVLAQNQREWGVTEPINFIFDKCPEQENTIQHVWESYLASVPDEVRSVTGRRPIFSDDREELPLQAADMWAWSCRRTWLENDGTIPEGSYPVRWGKFGDIPQIILQWTAEDIDEELSRISEALGTSRQRDVTDPGRPDRTVP